MSGDCGIGSMLTGKASKKMSKGEREKSLPMISLSMESLGELSKRKVSQIRGSPRSSQRLGRGTLKSGGKSARGNRLLRVQKIYQRSGLWHRGQNLVSAIHRHGSRINTWKIPSAFILSLDL